jgi:hypothetical protein
MEWLIGLILAALPFAILLACPIGMFLAMRMMGREHGSPIPTANRQEVPAVDRLQALERQQEELAREIALARRDLEGQPTKAREVGPAERG